MADPVSLGTLALTAVGAGAGIYGAAKAGTGGAAPQPAPSAPPPINPASAPSSQKPSKGGIQQSFLGGASALQQSMAGSGSTGATQGKTLLGA